MGEDARFTKTNKLRKRLQISLKTHLVILNIQPSRLIVPFKTESTLQVNSLSTLIVTN